MNEVKFYTAMDVQKILNISKSKVYNFLEITYITKQPFKVIKIGRMYRVNKESFDEWLNS